MKKQLNFIFEDDEVQNTQKVDKKKNQKQYLCSEFKNSLDKTKEIFKKSEEMIDVCRFCESKSQKLIDGMFCSEECAEHHFNYSVHPMPEMVVRRLSKKTVLEKLNELQKISGQIKVPFLSITKSFIKKASTIGYTMSDIGISLKIAKYYEEFDDIPQFLRK